MGLWLLECCYQPMRYAMFIFNLMFWIFGVILFAFSVWALADNDIARYFGASTAIEQLRGAAIVILLISLVILAAGFLGCCGAIKESRWMLACFFIILFVIFAILLAVGIAVLYRKDTLDNLVRSEFYQEIKLYREKAISGGLLSTAETNLLCCGSGDLLAPGVASCKDYLPRRPPKTCGQTELEACKRPGCTAKFIAFFQNNMHVLGAVAVTIAVLLILGMTFALCLFCGIRELTQNHHQQQQHVATTS